MAATSFFGGEFFGGEFFNDSPAPADDTFIRNFSLKHWREWKRDEDEERLEELVEVAEAAVKSAESAAVARAEGRLDDQAALLRAMEARQAYEDAYRAALRERYVAERVAEQWMADMKRLRRRRAAIMLLLH